MANDAPLTAPNAAPQEPEIYTIPDKFYGAALKAKTMSVEKPAPVSSGAPVEPSGTKRAGWILPVIIGVVLLAGVGGGFVYFNRDLLFKPAPAVQTPPPTPPAPTPVPVPSAPTNLTATATAPTVVNLTWSDTASNEAGYRVERRESATGYAPLTSLPPNTSAFLDVSAQPNLTYLYRVIALNASGDSLPSNEVSAQTPPVPPPPPEQAKLPPAGLDSDSDGLTDLEEPLYGTSARDPDADKDSFLDGNEVFHLYNPAGKQGVTLLQSGLVKVFESPVGWRVYVPTSWQITLNADGMSGSVSTGHGETFTMSVEDNAQKQSLLEWYLAKNPGVLSTQVSNITTKGGYEGLEGADLLTTYFLWGDKVFVFHYNLNDLPFVNFRTTYEMMKNSLSFSAAPNLPAPPQPAPATATSTLAPAVPPGPENSASPNGGTTTNP